MLGQIQGQVHPDPQHQVFPGGEQSGYGPHPSWGSVYFLAWVLAMKPLNIITSFDAKVKRAQSNEHKADRGAIISDFTLILQI